MGAAGSVPQEQKQPIRGSGLQGQGQDAMKRGFTEMKQGFTEAKQATIGDIMKSNFVADTPKTNFQPGQAWWQRGFQGQGFQPQGQGFSIQGQGTLLGGGEKKVAPQGTSGSTGAIPLQTFSDVKPIGSTNTSKIGELVGAGGSEPLKAEAIQVKNQYTTPAVVKAQQFKGW